MLKQQVQNVPPVGYQIRLGALLRGRVMLVLYYINIMLRVAIAFQKAKTFTKSGDTRFQFPFKMAAVGST